MTDSYLPSDLSRSPDNLLKSQTKSLEQTDLTDSDFPRSPDNLPKSQGKSDSILTENQQTENAPELKPLPSHLKYAYLGAGNSLPVIISNQLSQEEEEKLLDVLKKHKKAIGWTLEDIKGTSRPFGGGSSHQNQRQDAAHGAPVGPAGGPFSAPAP